MTSFSFLSAFTKYFCHQFLITFVASFRPPLHHQSPKFLTVIPDKFQFESRDTRHHAHFCSSPFLYQLALSHLSAFQAAQVFHPSHPRTVARSQPRFLPAVHRLPHDHAAPFSTSLQCSFHHSFNRKSPFPKREWT